MDFLNIKINACTHISDSFPCPCLKYLAHFNFGKKVLEVALPSSFFSNTFILKQLFFIKVFACHSGGGNQIDCVIHFAALKVTI